VHQNSAWHVTFSSLPLHQVFSDLIGILVKLKNQPAPNDQTLHLWFIFLMNRKYTLVAGLRRQGSDDEVKSRLLSELTICAHVIEPM